MTTVAAIAAYLPARRAASVDPVAALRAQEAGIVESDFARRDDA